MKEKTTHLISLIKVILKPQDLFNRLRAHILFNKIRRFLNKKLFDLKTSEDLKAESDIMKYWVKTKTINNLEDHDELISHIYRVNKKDNK